MKFEFVEFYPWPKEQKNKKLRRVLGTVHIYLIDYEIDLRGINVVKQGKGTFFSLPHIKGVDPETGQEVRYPVFRFTDQKKHEMMLDFLHKHVKPIILRRCNLVADTK